MTTPSWHKSRSFWESLGYAWAGIRAVWRQETNLRRQMMVGVLVLAAAWWLEVTGWQVVLLLLVSAMVLALEMMNSALELLMDVVHPGYDARLKVAKDMMAGAVLVMSLVAAAVGILVFAERLIALVAEMPY